MVVQDKPNYRDIPQGESGSNDRKQQRLRERFEVVKKLGQGTYGKVQLAINKETKQEVAIKTIKKAKIENEQDLVRIRREIQIMSSIRHPHIIHIYEVFENQEKIVLIMQYASGGELYDYLGCHKKLDENEARRVFRQVASAIFYCHKNRICHRDLKLENILLDDRGNAKIADFGLSNVFDERFKLKTFCGSPLYASPEIVRGTPYCGPEVDCWSLGVLLYTLVYGAMPFDGSNFKRLVKQISEGEYFEPKEKSGASGLIRRLLTVDISLRATIRDICTDWWVNQGYDHSLLKVASDMANLTPVRLDLLWALSSTASHAAGRPVQNQATITTKPGESRSILSNGYYSKSHPLHAPENGESRRRALATADGCRANNTNSANGIGKLQPISLAGNSQTLQDEQNDQMKGPESAIKTLAGDKNENNTFIIVQDLIKDVISKVEQHINISKTKLLKSTSTKLIQEKFVDDHNRISSSLLKGKCMTDSSEDAQKSKFPQSPTTEGASKNSLLQSSRVTSPVEAGKVFQNTQCFVRNSVGLDTVLQTTKIQGISDESRGKYFPEHVHSDTFSDRRKSIPDKNSDFPSRKSSVQMMEPDVVIPIFNVYSNIPKRFSDAAKSPSTNAKLRPALSSPTSKLNESKVSDYSVKSHSESLLEGEGKYISNSICLGSEQVSNTRSKDTLCKFKSRIPNGSDGTLQSKAVTSDSTPGNASGGTQEHSTDTEVPKLPPRKRLLIKIPKIESSNERDIVPIPCESDDTKSPKVCDKQEGKALRSGELELQKAGKEFILTSPRDDKIQILSFGSEEVTSPAVNKEQNVESSPKLPERKSRRDSSKRCLSFNSKSGMNQEFVSERQNWRKNKKEDLETVPNISVKELNSHNLSNVKHNDMNEVLKDDAHFLQSPTEHGITLPSDASSATENKSVQLEEYSKVATAEVMETEGNNIDLSQMYCDLLESFRNEANEMKGSNSRDVRDNSEILQQIDVESRRSRPLVRSKHRSLSRTRALSLEFESLALMPVRISGPPKKPPGKVEIPKNFDPTQVVTSPKAEMREIIFVPTACVSENKEKIQKKIEQIVTSPRGEMREIIFIPAACVSENKEIIQKKIQKVKNAAIVIPPRRKSDAGISSKRKKYIRSKTDFIVRPEDLATFAEDANLVLDDEQQDVMYREINVQSDEACSSENVDGEEVSNEMWYSAVSPDNEPEASEQRFKTFGECADNYEGFCNDNDATDNGNNKLHRHSVDAESGYWTPPDMTTGENSIGEASMKMKGEKHPKKSDNPEKVMLQRAAFRNSKMRMKLSDEGLDMCSLSSSLESGIYSWRQEEINGKRISPDSESALKVLSPMKFAEMSLEGSYPPIARSFKKMTFPPEHSSTSELSENCSIVGETDKNVTTYVGAPGKENHILQPVKPNGDTKPIKPSDSQSSYGSNDISDDVFESWTEKEDVVRPSKNDSSEDTENRGTSNTRKNNGQGGKARNWKRGETWQSFSTDKESSDNDDDLDLMIDEACQGVYGTEGLWQFLKSVNQNLSNQLKSASKKMSPKPLCHRSKSQESKHPDDVVSQKRPVTRSLSREEKQRKGGTQLRHFVSEGKLADADSMDFEDSYTHFDDTRYSSGYMASGSSLNDSGMLQKDFMSSVDSFNSNANDISIYGTLRKDKYFQSASALNSPCMTRRKKSLQNQYSSVDMSKLYGNAEDISNDELSKFSSLAEQNRKLSLYGTLRPKHLSQQGKAQSQILLSTDEGYQLLYNERPKKDISLETRRGSMGTLSSSGSKASSELNISLRENTIKDYEKLLLSDPKNLSITDSTYHTPRDKASSTVKKIISEKGNRRVSFSSDVKASKSDYHSSIRQNSLNKVREANEEMLSTSNQKGNTYDDEQDTGSLLEALKTYGYKGIMSQKLQSNSDKYETRVNYRLPTECYLSTGLCSTDWDNFEYIPLENTFTYQQAMYSPIDPMEYYPSKTFTRSSQMKRNIPPLSCDDDITFNDILRSHRLSEEDFISPRKPTHKFSDRTDVHLTHREKYAGDSWDANVVSSARKKSFDGTGVTLSNERRNGGSEKVLPSERERDKEGLGSTDVSESRGSKQTENPIEILSEKIQALKSRCQRKSSDENKSKKDFDESGTLAKEAQEDEKVAGSEAENERLQGYADSLDDLTAHEGESSESVSDRIWRKSFYSRFNDVSTTRRKKSSLMDSEFLSGSNFLRNTGKFNVDEEGGVEEPWINTTLKRRNSRRSVPKQTVSRASSLNSEASTNAEHPSVYKKRGTSSTETENKMSRVTERKTSPSQTNGEEQSMSAVFDKTSFHTSKDELGSITKVGKNRSNAPQNLDSCDTKETRTGTTGNKAGANELPNKSDIGTRNYTNSRQAERAENPASKLEQATSIAKGTDNISKTDMKECGSVANDTNNSAAELKNGTTRPEDLSSSSENPKTTSEITSDKHQGEDKATDSVSADAIVTQEHKPETDKE